jgi:dihydropteroate synthase
MVTPILRCGRFQLDLASPRVMGILNVTPDSFSDGGRYLSPELALARAEELLAEGAAVLDIGAESSRPGARPLDALEEWGRLEPVLRALRDCGVPLSVDTYKPEVMRRALDAGASMINDIWGLRQPGAVAVVAGSDCAVCVMHMQGDPASMQTAPTYQDVVDEVAGFLAERVLILQRAGIERARIVVDPGFGFGKTTEQNYALLRGLDRFGEQGCAVLAGLSRKSMLGAVTGRPVNERVGASVAGALAAASRGARLLRVHDVALTVEALKVWEIVENRPSTLISAGLNPASLHA